MSEPLRITRSEYERVRTAWMNKESSQTKFEEMFAPLRDADNPFPPYDPSPFEFLRKHIERKAKIDRAKRDYQSEMERLRKVFDDGSRDRGVVIIEDTAPGEPR